MKATHPTDQRPHPGVQGAVRLLNLVGRSAPPHRPVGGLLHRWYAASGTDLGFDEWADVATEDLGHAFERHVDLVAVEEAVVAFAEARAGADHGVAAVAADLVALVRLAWPAGRGTWGEDMDPVGLLARAMGAWAEEHTATESCGRCLDPLTGLVTAPYLRERVRELHDQCGALAIAPQMTFGALVVELDHRSATSIERVGTRVAFARLLAARFRGGETVATVGADRLVAIMPAYGIDRAVQDVTADLAGCDGADGVGVTLSRLAFSGDAATTFDVLAGTTVGS